MPNSLHDQPVHFVIRANAGSQPVFNPDSASELGIKPNKGGVGVAVQIGPETMKGQTAVVNYTVDAVPAERRVVWFDRDVAPGFDALIGPASVSQEVVIFWLGSPPGTKMDLLTKTAPTYRLPLTERGHRGMGSMLGNLFVQFDLLRETNIATAAAAADFAQNYEGTFVGEAMHERVRFGIDRPARRMDLGMPLVVGPIRVTTMTARMSEHDFTSGNPTASSDPEEFIVAVDGKQDAAERTLVLGREALAGCSSIVFDKMLMEIRLVC
jgi:hypothetical protein